MPHYLSPEELQRTAPAETAAFASPVPTQIVSNGEFNPRTSPTGTRPATAWIAGASSPAPPGWRRRSWP